MIKVSETFAGTEVIADGGFSCIRKGQRLFVGEDHEGLYIPCTEGKHHLAGQYEHSADGDYFIGLERAS